VIRHFTASGIVLSDDGHVLLVEHRKLGWWMYPGGHIDPDEDPAQAVLREVTEETGISRQTRPNLGSATPPPPCSPAPFTICVQDIPANATTGPHQHIDRVYILTPGSGQPTPQLKEVIGCAWIPLDKVADLDTPPELPALIKKAAEYARAVRE
jgi:8-oxo-dGTP diphosphatase